MESAPNAGTVPDCARRITRSEHASRQPRQQQPTHEPAPGMREHGAALVSRAVRTALRVARAIRVAAGAVDIDENAVDGGAANARHVRRIRRQLQE